MSKIKTRMKKALVLILVALISVVAIVGCSPQERSSSSEVVSTAETMPVEAGVYVSDEQCLSCHGESYEALAKTTAELGDWNPHNSIHGGYNSCVNCHDQDRVISHNYCNECHVYAPQEEVLY